MSNLKEAKALIGIVREMIPANPENAHKLSVLDMASGAISRAVAEEEPHGRVYHADWSDIEAGVLAHFLYGMGVYKVNQDLKEAGEALAAKAKLYPYPPPLYTYVGPERETLREKMVDRCVAASLRADDHIRKEDDRIEKLERELAEAKAANVQMFADAGKRGQEQYQVRYQLNTVVNAMKEIAAHTSQPDAIVRAAWRRKTAEDALAAYEAADLPQVPMMYRDSRAKIDLLKTALEEIDQPFSGLSANSGPFQVSRNRHDIAMQALTAYAKMTASQES